MVTHHLFVSLISGVPQGPVLFLLYVNDLTDIFPSSVFSELFADDVKLYIHIDSDADVAVLQDCLALLEKWSVTWQLSISIKKCSILMVSSDAVSYTHLTLPTKRIV